MNKYFIRKTFFLDDDENPDYENSKYNIIYCGKKHLKIMLRIDNQNNLHLDYFLSHEKSGVAKDHLIKIIYELTKFNYINKNSQFFLSAQDLSSDEKRGIDRLVNYYKKMSFQIDTNNPSNCEDLIDMKTTIQEFMNTNPKILKPKKKTQKDIDDENYMTMLCNVNFY